MNTKALEAVFHSIGWFVDEKGFPSKIANARRTLADPNAHPSQRETAGRIIAAADGHPAPAAQSSAGASSEDHETVAAAAGSEAAIILGSTAEGREVTLGDVEKEGLQLFASLAKFTDVGASVRDMILEREAAKKAKAAGLAKMPDLPGLRVAIEKGRKDWTGSPWPYTTEQGMAAEIANQGTLLRDRAHTAPGAKGLLVYPKGPGDLAKHAPPDLLAKARALGVDVDELEGAALAAKMDPMKALEAEVYNQELLAGDRTRAAV
jgi:hypothetical protein